MIEKTLPLDIGPVTTLVTFAEELELGVNVRPEYKDFLARFYADLDEDWFERKESPRWFHNEWEKYEWLFKRAMAGYPLTAEDFMFMHCYEVGLEYRTDTGWRYEQLKLIFAEELKPVFGTLHHRRNPQ